MKKTICALVLLIGAASTTPVLADRAFGSSNQGPPVHSSGE